MARKKSISDERILILLEQYIEEKCFGNSKKVKIPKFGDYIRNSGYPNIADTTLRRNKSFREVLQQRNELLEDSHYQTVFTYKTLDVDSFMMTNRTPKTIKKALIDFNLYQKKIVEAALHFQKEADILKENNQALKSKVESYKEKYEKLIEHKKTNKALESEIKILKDFIKTTIYPEIANELLKQEGLLKSDTQMITNQYLANDIITPDAQINFHQTDSETVNNSDSLKKETKVVSITNILDSKTKYMEEDRD